MGYNEFIRRVTFAARQEGFWGMNIQSYDAILLFFGIVTAFLLVLTHINHSRATLRYRILKFSLWLLLVSQMLDFFRLPVWCKERMYPAPMLFVIFVGYYLCAFTVMNLIVMYMLLLFPGLAKRRYLLYTMFFVMESVSAVLILSNDLTGLVYTVDMGRLIAGPADSIFFAVRLIFLSVFLICVLFRRKNLPQKLFENWAVILVLGVSIHLLSLVVKNPFTFDYFADVFLCVMLFLFHFGTYEEGNARMGTDMYRSELSYSLEKQKQFYVFEIKILNYDRLVERRLYTEEDMDAFYGLFYEKLAAVNMEAMVFQKKHISLGVLIGQIVAEEAVALAEKMTGWMNELFAGQLRFGIVAAECPKYAKTPVNVERMLRFLQKKCGENSYYFCNDKDYEEYCERETILRLLHDMHLQKQDVILFGRPVISCKNTSEAYLEVLCRLQVAGNGIVHSENVIELAERYGYIHDVNMAVLANVCDFLERKAAEREYIHVSLHISGEELENPGFVKDVLSIVNQHELAPQSLGFEVTMVPGEGDLTRMQKVISELRDQQILFTLVDFDPMCANFESVMGLPFEMIKFERHCIKRASESAACYDTMGLLVDTFKEHGFFVAFKGIDNAGLEEIALSLGADFVQGEKYTKPFPIDRIDEQKGSWSI